MTIRVPDPPPRRQDKADCPMCGATARGCASNQWLRAQKCCKACLGNHDAEAAR